MGRFGKVILFLAAVALSIGMAKTAGADAFDMTWDGTYGAGNAILTATNDGFGQFTVTAITGEQGGTTITALLPPNAYFNDNFIYPALATKLDFNGISFAEGTTDFNLFFFPPVFGGPNMYVECSSGVCPTLGQIGLSTPLTSFNIVPVAAPEPGIVILLLVGLSGLAVLRFRKQPAGLRDAA
jgi:hypothetical protein